MNVGFKNLRCGASLAVLATLLVGCDSFVGPGERSTVSVSTAMAAAAVPLSDPFGRTINIELVQMVLADIELERIEELEDCDSSGHDDCEEIDAGPVLIDFPSAGAVITPFFTAIPIGSYDELELEIEEPNEDDAATAAFLAANPGWPPEASVRVKGTFDAADGNGPQAFDVFIQTEAEIEREFDPPFVVEADTNPSSLNITVVVDVNEWFLNGDGSLIDPRVLSADGALRERVEDNI